MLTRSCAWEVTMRTTTAKQLLVSLGGALATVLLFAPSWPESVEVVQPVGPKADQLVMVCIFDGPTGRICLDPMTRQEAYTYQDAEPEVYTFGTTAYADALEEIRLAEVLAETPSAGFRITPATIESLVKRARTFSYMGLDFP